MSEYQYYEFRTINRQLTAAERTAVDKLSSHGHTTATSFSVDYSYGDFKHDPNQVLARYFDLFFYMANWGTVTLKFRYPKGLLDLRRLEPYCLDSTMVIDHQTVGDSVIIGFDWNPEDSTDWIEADGLVDGVVGLYQEIMGGDYRALYLAWLRAIQNGADYSGEFEEETLEPPVPPGLDELSPALTDFMALFEIDKDLVAAAAKGSSAATIPTISGTRTVSELLTVRDEMVQRRRQAVAAAKEAKRRADLSALAGRGDQVWQEVETFIEQKTGEGYKQAITLLQQLGDLAREQGQGRIFASRVEQLRNRYSRRSAFIRELQRVQL